MICVLSPRDIKIVKEGHETFKDVPHLYLKYWKACQAYKIIEDFFKENTEFSHVVIAPDDLVVFDKHYNALVEDLEKEDFPVLGGICNINTLTPKTLAICIDELPSIIRRERASRTGRKYHYAQLDSLPIPEGIIKVKFAGMPFLFIRRDVVEQIGFTGDTIYDPTRKHLEPRVFDLAFCYECDQKNIPIHVDARVKLLHLNGPMDNPKLSKEVETHKVGKEEPKVYFQKDDEIQDFSKEYQRLIYNLDPFETNYIIKPYIS